MTNDEFCKIDTAFYGDVVDDIKQIGLRSFNGEELKQYVEAAINYTRCCETLNEDNYEHILTFKDGKLISDKFIKIE